MKDVHMMLENEGSTRSMEKSSKYAALTGDPTWCCREILAKVKSVTTIVQRCEDVRNLRQTRGKGKQISPTTDVPSLWGN